MHNCEYIVVQRAKKSTRNDLLIFWPGFCFLSKGSDDDERERADDVIDGCHSFVKPVDSNFFVFFNPERQVVDVVEDVDGSNIPS